MSALDAILLPVIEFIENTISATGAWGVVILMAIESFNIPLPSEAILPFAGYLVSKGVMSIHTASFAGAFGCVIGSIPSYYIGYFGGRPFFEKYGKMYLHWSFAAVQCEMIFPAQQSQTEQFKRKQRKVMYGLHYGFLGADDSQSATVYRGYDDPWGYSGKRLD